MKLGKNRIRTTLGPAYLNIADELCKNTVNGVITNERTKTDFYKIIHFFYKRNNIKL